MNDAPTRQEWEMAQLKGEQARQAGKRLTDCPIYGGSQKAATLREAWREGFERVSEQRRRG